MWRSPRFLPRSTDLGTCHYLAGGGGGGGEEGYQFSKQGSQKILTLPLNTNKKIVTLPQP